MDSQTQHPSEPVTGDNPLVTLFRHNLWANLNLIDACTALDAGQLATRAVGVYGTLYDTLHHIVRAEQHYLALLTGRKTVYPLRREQSPEIAVIREQARLAGEGLIAYAAVVTPDAQGYGDDDEDENIVWPIPAGFLLTQVVNHATEHRAQVMTLLSQLGIEPPDLSGWKYMDDTVVVTPIPRSEAGRDV